MTEKLDIAIHLNINYAEDYPQYKIFVNEQLIDLPNTITRPRIPFERKFSIELPYGKHKLIIDTGDQLSKNTTMTLFNIYINKFRCNTNNLMYKNSAFVDNSGASKPIKNIPCVFFENGRFEFEFESPFAYWALEQL